MKNTIKVDGILYAKTAAFGNRELRVIHRNRKKYNRKDFKTF